jgi:hypothetical protein
MKKEKVREKEKEKHIKIIIINNKPRFNSATKMHINEEKI